MNICRLQIPDESGTPACRFQASSVISSAIGWEGKTSPFQKGSLGARLSGPWVVHLTQRGSRLKGAGKVPRGTVRRRRKMNDEQNDKDMATSKGA